MAVLATLPKTQVGPGEVISPSVTVPIGTGAVRVVANMDATDKANSAVTFHCELEVSDDGGTTFHGFAGFGFTGDPNLTNRQGDVLPDPYINVDGGMAALLWGKKVRAHFGGTDWPNGDLSQRINLGATILSL